MKQGQISFKSSLWATLIYYWLFVKASSNYGPVDSFVTPEPWAMPGYGDRIVMAAGSFVQGSSIELSADAPMREPYNIFLQAGLNRYHTKIALGRDVGRMDRQGLDKNLNNIWI